MHNVFFLKGGYAVNTNVKPTPMTSWARPVKEYDLALETDIACILLDFAARYYDGKGIDGVFMAQDFADRIIDRMER